MEASLRCLVDDDSDDGPAMAMKKLRFVSTKLFEEQDKFELTSW